MAKDDVLKRRLSPRRTSITLNVKELLGFEPQTETTNFLVGQSAIEKIVERTDQNTSVNGTNFRKYDPDYVDSQEFRAFGKSASDVNMSLTGEMMGTMEVLGTTKNTVTIGWPDSENNAKAFNHNTGDTVPKREFFSLTNDELREIKNEFTTDEPPPEDVSNLNLSTLFAIAGNIGGGS